jgi:hypothetical protein
MRRAMVVLAAAAVILPVLPVPPAVAEPAVNSTDGPIVGECYDLTDQQASADLWDDAEAVPCTERHTFEVTETAPVPQDVNAIEFAEQRCGLLDVWTAVGVNASTVGVIEDPIRVESRSYYARPDHYVCGAVAVRYRGTDPATLVTLRTSFDRMRLRTKRALRHCASAEDGRRALSPPVTVRCASRPRWQVTAWILWSALYDDYPGRRVLKRRAAALCGPGTVVSVPPLASWEEGIPRSWCYRKVT